MAFAHRRRWADRAARTISSFSASTADVTVIVIGSCDDATPARSTFVNGVCHHDAIDAMMMPAPTMAASANRCTRRITATMGLPARWTPAIRRPVVITRRWLATTTINARRA